MSKLRSVATGVPALAALAALAAWPAARARAAEPAVRGPEGQQLDAAVAAPGSPGRDRLLGNAENIAEIRACWTRTDKDGVRGRQRQSAELRLSAK